MTAKWTCVVNMFSSSAIALNRRVKNSVESWRDVECLVSSWRAADLPLVAIEVVSEHVKHGTLVRPRFASCFRADEWSVLVLYHNLVCWVTPVPFREERGCGLNRQVWVGRTVELHLSLETPVGWGRVEGMGRELHAYLGCFFFFFLVPPQFSLLFFLQTFV